MTIEVRRADLDEILPLRKAVLRPSEPVVASDYDHFEQTQHIGAFDEGIAVGCATVFPSPYDSGDPAFAGDHGAWQLRGMAVLPDRQGTGVGRQVLDAAIAVVQAAGATSLWANARITALPFYSAMGFAVVSEEFRYGPAELPHKRILLRFHP
jgi:GNAT superfamily N-acetyltransferase